LEKEPEVSARRAILLSLGEYGLDRFSQDQRLRLVPTLLQLYREDVDPGIHGAAEWLLRQWKREDELKRIDKELTTGKVEGKRRWYVNRQGQTMVILAGGGEFWMGEGKERRRMMIGRSFALASKEVTVEQFLRFRKDHTCIKQYAPTDDCPVNNFTWYDAAAYCNWLSEQEGIPMDQWCYEPNKDGRYAEGMKIARNYWQRTGYRLPIEAEWEYACRAGAGTGYSFGEAVDLLGKYGWHIANSPSRIQAVGMLRPNDNGLFDMHGNAWEWTQSLYKEYGKAESGMMDDKEYKKDINNHDIRVMRGGSFINLASKVRSADRGGGVPTFRNLTVGFRPARTFTP
jgi:formylglycine-generating enzyme required for sulfatase activity